MSKKINEQEPKEINPNKAYTSYELGELLRMNYQTASQLIRDKKINAKLTGNKYLILGSEIIKYLKGGNDD